ncbi:hypothetical protein GCM10028775_46870 [Catellatospora paridis]
MPLAEFRKQGSLARTHAAKLPDPADAHMLTVQPKIKPCDLVAWTVRPPERDERSAPSYNIKAA